jgi:AcrR family transcriptional regulator
MVAVKPPRQRRAQRAEATRRRVVEEASQMFVAAGYQATTIEAIAEAADVSVETIYKRFGSKRALLRAAIALSVADTPDPESPLEELLSLPALQRVADERDQAVQLKLLAAFSRDMQERTAPIHRMLYGAGDELADVISTNHAVRRRGQRAVIDLLAANGPLRLPVDAAADTYSALVNPDLYQLLTDQHGWTPQQYESWLSDTLGRLLLPDPTPAPRPRRRAPNAGTQRT